MTGRRRRDGERTAVGEAEEAAFGGTEAEIEQPWAVLVDRAHALTTGGWWSAVGGPPVTVARSRVTARSSCARVRGDGPVVALSLADGQLDLATLAHELAHAVAGVDHGHDDRFRLAEIDVVALIVGSAAARSLAEAFPACGRARAARPWPLPWHLDGDGFRVLASPIRNAGA